MIAQALLRTAAFTALLVATGCVAATAEDFVDFEDLEAAISFEIDAAQRQLERKQKLLAETEKLLDSESEYDFIKNAYKGMKDESESAR